MEYFGLVITHSDLGDYEIIGRSVRGFAVRRNINGINCIIKLPIDKHLLIYNNEETGKMISDWKPMVLSKLDKYREKANRDRFILPVEKDIKYFIDIIDNCINFLIK
jgi:hypothetical protein